MALRLKVALRVPSPLEGHKPLSEIHSNTWLQRDLCDIVISEPRKVVTLCEPTKEPKSNDSGWYLGTTLDPQVDKMCEIRIYAVVSHKQMKKTLANSFLNNWMNSKTALKCHSTSILQIYYD